MLLHGCKIYPNEEEGLSISGPVDKLVIARVVNDSEEIALLYKVPFRDFVQTCLERIREGIVGVGESFASFTTAVGVGSCATTFIPCRSTDLGVSISGPVDKLIIAGDGNDFEESLLLYEVPLEILYERA